MAYYYDGRSFRDIRDALDAVRDDIDLSLGDSDLDSYLRENGAVVIDGEAYRTASALKRVDHSLYREIRDEFIERIMSDVRDGADSGEFPLRIPFTGNVLESSE